MVSQKAKMNNYITNYHGTITTLINSINNSSFNDRIINYLKPKEGGAHARTRTRTHNQFIRLVFGFSPHYHVLF